MATLDSLPTGTTPEDSILLPAGPPELVTMTYETKKINPTVYRRLTFFHPPVEKEDQTVQGHVLLLCNSRKAPDDYREYRLNFRMEPASKEDGTLILIDGNHREYPLKYEYFESDYAFAHTKSCPRDTPQYSTYGSKLVFGDDPFRRVGFLASSEHKVAHYYTSDTHQVKPFEELNPSEKKHLADQRKRYQMKQQQMKGHLRR